MALEIKGDIGTKRRLRAGMVGGGQGAFIGAVHRMALRLDDRYEFVAGALSSDPRRARRSAQELGLARDRTYTSYEEMAAAESRRPDGIDVVAIVTPNNLHFGPARAFLEAGIHVICDKPLVTTLKEALALERIVGQSGLVFGLTHTYTGYPMVRQAREMVTSGALGNVRASQIAVGCENDIKVRVYGDQAGLEWRHEEMNYLKFTPYGEAPRRLSRSGAGSLPVAARASRVPAGHPEGYIEGFTQLYTDFAEQIAAKIERRKPDPASLLAPGIGEGVEGMRFIESVLKSSRRNSSWVKIGG